MSDSYVDAEDLDDDAIVAHAAPVHSPPSRAQVRQARRSVVIAERGADDRTVVLSRRALGQLEKGGKRRLRPWLVWGMAGVFAFGAGGVLSSWLSAKRAPQAAAKPAPPRTAPPPQAAAARGPEPSVRVVSVGDLPLEKRR